MPDTTLGAAPCLGTVFHALPGLYLIISPEFIVLEATDAYLQASMQQRQALLGRDVFDVFPNNPAAPEVDSVQLIRQSLEYVVQHKQKHSVPSLRYDIPCPEHLGGGFSERYWSSTNTPVLDEAGNLTHIIHETRDITEKLAGELIEMHRQEQLSLLRSTVEAVSWEYDFKGNSVSWGRGLLDIFGYLPEEMGKDLSSWQTRMHPLDYKAVTESLKKATGAGSRVWTSEYRFRKANGTYAVVLDQAYLVYDSHGNPSLAIGSIMDISKNKRAEQQLKESDARFRHLLEVLPHMAWTAEANGSGMYFNKDWYSYTGIPAGHAESWVRALHPDDTAYVLTSWHEALAHKNMFEVEYRIRNAYDGKYRWFLERGVPMCGENGQVKLWLGTFTDIDDQKEALKQLRQKDYQMESILQLSPAHICLLQGPVHICKFVTPGIYTMYGNRRFLGRPAREIWPELVNENFEELLDQVYRQGKVITKNEVQLQVDLEKRGQTKDAYFNIKYQSIENSEGSIEGILISAIEVTALILAKQKIAALLALQEQQQQPVAIVC